MTYAELVQAVGAWLNSVEIEPSIPTFIQLAEAQINRRLAEAGISGAVQRATAQVDSEYSTAPADLARVLGARLASGRVVRNVTPEGLETLRGAQPQATGAPTHMALVGGDLRFFPTPAKPCSVELSYQARPSAISDQSGSNWLLASHPDVYLYGALVQAALFAQDGRAQSWDGLYNAGLDALIRSESDKRGSPATAAFRAGIPNRCGHDG